MATKVQEKESARRACGCPLVGVLCQCGWGRLGIVECDVPEYCPVCGFDFWSYGGAPVCGGEE